MNRCIGDNCSRCGYCCTPFLPMSKNEVKTIKAYLKNNPNILKEAYENNPIKGNTIYIRCCFYKDNSCMIYPVRPWICKVYKCNQSESEIQENKRIASNRSYYNTENIRTITDFRDILFNDKSLIIAGMHNFLQFKSFDELKEFCIKINRKDIIKDIKEEVL